VEVGVVAALVMVVMVVQAGALLVEILMVVYKVAMEEHNPQGVLPPLIILLLRDQLYLGVLAKLMAILL
jgi:hypothetical protein